MDTNGVLLIKKDKGIISHDVVQGIRRRLSASKVGHIGTLDPAASGMLPIMLGDANRLHIYLSKGKKKYAGSVFLGQSTDTYDAAGEPTSKLKEVNFSEQEIRDILYDFTGIIEQVPPPYSAVKLKGKPLHKYARAGDVQQAKSRTVEIFSIYLDSLNDNILDITVVCAQGTYIRSIANDIGAKLGCGAHLRSLERRAVGEFDLEDSVRFDDLWNDPDKILSSSGFVPLGSLLPNIPKLSVLDEEAYLFSCGGRINLNTALLTQADARSLTLYQKEDPNAVKVFFGDKMLGIGMVESGAWVRPATVFGPGLEMDKK